MKNYTIISGTGRAGTTLLVRILMKAGIDAGFESDTAVDPVAHAGLELDLRTKPDCKLVKSPWIATYIDEVVRDAEIKIDHAIICMRSLSDAAESRRRVQREQNTDAHVAGGLWGVTDPADQEAYLAEMFHRLLFTLSANAIPMTFLHFPRFANDVNYFVEMIHPVFPDVTVEDLRSAYDATVAPGLISDFSKVRAPVGGRSSKAAAESASRAHLEKIETELATLNKLVGDQRDEIARFAVQFSEMARISQALDRRDQENASLSCDLASSWARIAELDQAAEQLSARKRALEDELKGISDALRASERARELADQQVQALLQSRSWKLTRPLRGLAGGLAGLRSSAKQ
ncbi:hypothetical protein LPW26_10355 [Rhodopseudomonas sp. HC1]|uniref:hypothetical protein n=1 Tax=Rhodopseudomonas infernalis TaxID=2897386 RepID=UPI001EE81173|nr:hypothetical protein [Rhodopseudomonas infernalis]MCG6205039.1 hypothetical protein [Rhodopseudomonas infernalis]